jgi:hypothetical protein
MFQGSMDIQGECISNFPIQTVDFPCNFSSHHHHLVTKSCVLWILVTASSLLATFTRLSSDKQGWVRDS